MSKRPAVEFEQDPNGKRYWKSLPQYRGDEAQLAQLPAEFPPGLTDAPDGISRRTFFNLMGASFALGGLAACRRPEEKIVPYAQAPEEQLPGKALHYATVTTFGGTAVGLLVESNDGRPTKIEGNPQHPESPGGGVAPWVQASVLDLYDPDRSDRPRTRKDGKLEDASWGDVAAALKTLGSKARATQGARLAIITEAHRSPTLKAQLELLKRALPQARIISWDPTGRASEAEGTRLAFGKPHDVSLDLSKAKILVTLDADVLASEGSIVKNARGFAAGRKPDAPGGMNRLYAIESSFSVTGSAADHRLRLASHQVAAFAFALAGELGGELAAMGQIATRAGLPATAVAWAKSIAKDLASKRGEVVVVAGTKQSAAVHAVVAAMNLALGAAGRTVKYLPAFDDGAGQGAQGLVALAQAIDAGQIDTVLILGGNPAFTAPADAPLEAALAKVTTVHLSSHRDETSQVATWHLNRCHELESWGDAVADDGSAALVQPLIAPLFDARSDAEVVALFLGEAKRGYDLVRKTWEGLGDRAWRKALHDGVIEGSALASAEPTANLSAIGRGAGVVALSGIEVTFGPDSHAWDGRFANNGWLQEWPEPMHKLTWGNAATVSPATAAKLGLTEGETIAIETAAGSARLPVIIAPGRADDSIGVTFGQGRRTTGRVGKDVGSDTYALRASTALGFVGDAKITSLGGDANLARTQEHFSLEPMEGFAKRPLVREASLDEYKADPTFVKKSEVPHPPLFNLWKDQKTDVVHKWGLAIDLNTCDGCGACQIACQSENNIPVVGADGVRRSREMNWLRIDRYFEGNPEDARAVAQPMPCQQCESAPCEQVCPVAATVHSEEGLNDMAYNRCVGTRYCANNCPFKVRKFNFFNYHKHTTELEKLSFNPDVTVRSRGVMEKCTYCTQRITAGKIAAKRLGTDKIVDGAIQTACQQACPSGSIVFGDYNDPESQLSKLEKDPRAYRLLEEINIRPRTVYLARIRNLNPELEQA